MQPNTLTSASPRASIQVALVEDDVNFQNALRAAFEAVPDMRLLHVTGSREQGLCLLDQAPVDVLLVDLGLPDGSGIDVVRAAHARWPGCDIMVCTTFGDEAAVIQSIEAGAAGYLLKDGTSEELVSEIRNLRAGGSPISPLIARKILARFRSPETSIKVVEPRREPGPKGSALSEREREALEYISKGFTSSEIAELMDVSYHTVQTYVRRIYAKLEVHSKTEAIYEARNQGLLDR